MSVKGEIYVWLDVFVLPKLKPAAGAARARMRACEEKQVSEELVSRADERVSGSQQLRTRARRRRSQHHHVAAELPS